MAQISGPMLLATLLCLCITAVSARRSLFQSGANATLTGLVVNTDSLSSLETALTTANLTSVLNGNGTYTVFAPSDAAFTASIKSMYCIKDYGFAKKCSNISDLLASQNLATTLLNHVVVGSFPAASLTNGTVLKTVGGALQRVAILANGTVTVGGAPVVSADVAATNGIAHVMGAVLYRDAAFNSSTISSYLTTLADLGPQTTSPQSFSEAEKTLMIQDALDNVDRFRSYRSIVEKPDGGYLYPMPMLFDNTQGNRESHCTPQTQPKWTYPALPNVTRPADNETLAYMTVSNGQNVLLHR